MTPFTDEDKKGLGYVEGIKGERLLALLARLEAAEKAIMFAYLSEYPIDESAEEAYQAWKKACGK